jgi:tRNA pseudouridine55 synthase
METADPSGILIIDKPGGLTSHDVVGRVRRTLRTRAVGHAGTLDPMATGVLVVVVGEATKLARWLTAEDKVYEATVAFGIETDTLDAEGRAARTEAVGPDLRTALSRSSPSAGVAPLLEAALAAERQRTTQIPPAYSAIQVDGERAHTQARKGASVVLPPRPVHVRRIDLVECSADPASCSLRVEASKGYYVRSLARDLAIALGTAGHLTRLRRARSGAFGLDESIPVTASAEAMRSHLQPLAKAVLRALPAAHLTPAGVEDARHGRRVRFEDIAAPTAGPCAWLDAAGALVAIGETRDDGARVLRGFAPARASEPPCAPLLEPL